MEAFTPDPRFSVDAFFYSLFVFTLISLVAFVLLNMDHVVAGSLVKSNDVTLNDSSPYSSSRVDKGGDEDGSSSRENSQVFGGDVSVFEMPKENDGPFNVVSSGESNDNSMSSILGLRQSTFLYLICVQVFICFWANGFFPSIQSYSSLPYGNVAYHLAVTLSNMANPAVCILAFFIPTPTAKSISGVAGVSVVISGWVLYLALKSPSPPMMGTTGGEVIMVRSI